MTPPTIWIDVTDLTTWTGNLTGIQRTHFHLGQEFAKKGNVKFFAASYDKGIREVEQRNVDSENSQRFRNMQVRQEGLPTALCIKFSPAQLPASPTV